MSSLSDLFMTSQELTYLAGANAGAKLLIIHADDLALSHSVNEAIFAGLKEGRISSASVMVPCPWMPEVAVFAKSHPNMDLGIHLTLTSEFSGYRWGPVAPVDCVASLVDANGYFWQDTSQFLVHAKPQEV